VDAPGLVSKGTAVVAKKADGAGRRQIFMQWIDAGMSYQALTSTTLSE
jgi:hypothetical protein